MFRINYLFMLLFIFFGIGCARSEKIDAQENKNHSQLPKQSSPEDLQKYNKLGWDLCNAVSRKNIERALEAIRAGADINFICDSGDLEYFPLLIATHHVNLKMVKLLLDNGAKVDFTASSGFTSLMDTAVNGQPEIAKVLIEYKANVNAVDADGWTALMCAAKFNQLEMVKLLIKNGADVNLKDKTNKTALMYAEENKNTAIIKALKAAGAGELRL